MLFAHVLFITFFIMSLKSQTLAIAFALTAATGIQLQAQNRRSNRTSKDNVTSNAKTENPKLKYVFYFVSDGTGVNTVLGTEMFNAERKGGIGRLPLCMTSFPVVGVSSTYSASNGVTDSAASGTCLASGVKTYNGAIGVDMDTLNVYSVAEWAKDYGVPVGVASSVCINHATPAAYYAHCKSRQQYYDIAMQAASAGFDFYGGSDFHLESSKRDKRAEVYKSLSDAGYVIARGMGDYRSKSKAADRLVLIQQEDAPSYDDFCLPYWIDRKDGQLTIPEILRAQIEFLYKKSEERGGKGFFLMNEIGGKVDFGCHANDGATAFAEVAATDSCVRIAYEFYKQHPDETLIVLTSDHETGGLTLGNMKGKYRLNLSLLANQKCSLDECTRHLQALRAKTDNNVSWEMVNEVLRKDFGFWETVQLSQKENDAIRELYEKSFVGQIPNEDNLYSSNEPMAAEAVRLMNARAFLAWTTTGHTAGLVPVYACGVGAEQFMGHNDNGEIAIKIAKLAGYTVKQKK